MIESDVERTVCLRAELKGWLVRKLRWVGRRNAPDRLFAKKGRVVLVEFKRPGRGAEGTQSKEINRFKDAGIEVYMINTVAMGDAVFD